MANIATILKSEITRLARKEVRTEIASLRKSNAAYRRDIAALKRTAGDLQRQIAALARSKVPAKVAEGSKNAKARFSAQGLKTHRARLGLSAGDYGKLAGVSGQSIYNWESGQTVPRDAQSAALASVRRLGKRSALAKLEGGN